METDRTTHGAPARVLRTEDYGQTWSVSESTLLSGPLCRDILARIQSFSIRSSGGGGGTTAAADQQHGSAVGGDYNEEDQGDRQNCAVTWDEV